MDQPNNSDKARAEREKRYKEQAEIRRRPVSTSVQTKKKEPGMIESLLREFIVKDITEVKSNVVKNVIKPGIKRTVYNAATEGLRQLLDDGGSIIDNRRTDFRRISEGSISSPSIATPKEQAKTRNLIKFDSRNYPVRNRAEAEEVVYILQRDIVEYGRALVAAFLKAVGEDPDYNDYSIGWTDLSEGTYHIRDTIDGTVITLPPPIRVAGL